MMRRLRFVNISIVTKQMLTILLSRQVNVDHQHVGWYQSSQFGNFLSPQLLESQFSYQTSIEESVCLIFGNVDAVIVNISTNPYFCRHC